MHFEPRHGYFISDSILHLATSYPVPTSSGKLLPHLARVPRPVIINLPLKSSVIITEPHCEAEGEIEENKVDDSIQPVHRDKWHGGASVSAPAQMCKCPNVSKCAR